MNKLRSLTSHLPSLSSPSMPTSSKLSKAFHFDKRHNVLTRQNTRGAGQNPFLDGPIYEEPSLPKWHLWIHLAALFFTFLAICTMGAVAGFQAKWVGVSGGTGFVLFLLLLAFILSAGLVVIPIVYDRWDRLKRPAQFLAQTRSTLILHAFGAFLLLLAAFIVTISAWTEKGCKNADNDPHADKGDDFKNGLKQWCTTKKASGVFDWFAFAAWLALLILTAVTFRRERRRDPSFVPPTNDTGISYANILAQDDERYTRESKPEPAAAAVGVVAHDSPRVDSDEYERSYGYAPVAGGAGVGAGALSRPSVDAYGAFDGDMPGGGHQAPHHQPQPSRTMQMAYSDPYAQIRQSLLANPGSEGYSIAQDVHAPSTYGNGGLPNPPSYGGYR